MESKAPTVPDFHAWIAGIKACEEGKSRENCPFIDPAEANEWYSGFDTASAAIYRGDIKI